ncbi:penicillin-binding transpeptidase domain-containing protein, partial [Salmonella enterica]|uniref:penicillin-binding transpeptidase domain-containing protein n=1 Tax=Salmonella enterica TaxID=28901 RepID=UPI003D2E3AAD
MEDELSRGMLETHAKGAAGIILDVDTGELIALASLPAFDPNRGDLARNALVFNRASNRVYELGSAFKPITIASAIDAG